MTHFKILIPAFALVAVMAAAPAHAQARGRSVVVGHAAPRVVGPRVVGARVVPISPYIYRPGIGLGLYYGYPYYYGLYGYPLYGYPYGYPVYGYGPYAAQGYGGVRIEAADKQAEVYADGYYVGVVDDFDGTFQQLSLQPGPHHIEVRSSGAQAVGFDVNVQPGQTITYRAAQHPAS